MTFSTGWIRSAIGFPISGSIRNGSNSGKFSVGMKKYFCVGEVLGSASAFWTSCSVRQKVLQSAAGAYFVWTNTIPSPALRTDRRFSGYRGKSAKPSYSRV